MLQARSVLINAKLARKRIDPVFISISQQLKSDIISEIKEGTAAIWTAFIL